MDFVDLGKVLTSSGFFHRLDFRWSSVELSLQSHFVCEEQGVVALDMIRKGNLAESSYVTVQVSRSFRTSTCQDVANFKPASWFFAAGRGGDGNRWERLHPESLLADPV